MMRRFGIRCPGQTRPCDDVSRRNAWFLSATKTGEGMKQRRIFISHSQDDREWVRAFAEALEAQGVQVWLDELQIPAGERLEEAIEQGLRGSDVVVFVITADSIHGPSLFFELGAAVGLGKRLVPIVSKGLPPSELPYPLRVHRFLLRESPEETARNLLAETAALCPGASPREETRNRL